MIDRRTFLATATAAAAVAAAPFPGHSARAQAQSIRIGDINSYTGPTAALTEPYRKGWRLALEQINTGGGVRGLALEVISRDDAGDPATAVRAAEELLNRERCVLLSGTHLSQIGLALAGFAKQRRVFFMAGEPLTDALTWANGNSYTFRLRPNTYTQCAMLAEEAALLQANRWVTVAPNSEYGKAAVAAFKLHLKRRRPEVQFVTEQWPAMFKIDAPATAAALLEAKPEAIFNATFGEDLRRLVAEGRPMGLFDWREVVSLLAGEPEHLDPFGADAPQGWLVTGYPWYGIETPEHKAFLAAYRAKWDEPPRLASVVGYSVMLSLAGCLARTEGLASEQLVAAMKELEVSMPFGPITWRASDHQSTMGTFVGRTGLSHGEPVMVDWRYADGADYLPGGDELTKLRGMR